jgi:ABC-type lipoprotein export system ATPase subunit
MTFNLIPTLSAAENVEAALVPLRLLVTHDSVVAARAPRLGQLRDGVFEETPVRRQQ